MLIGCKWVFKIKKDPKGNIQRYRARLVAKGFSQIEGIDYEEINSPVASFYILCLLLVLTSKFNF